MSDGRWTGQQATEIFDQAELTRHRILWVNTSNVGTKNAWDSSSYASLDPNAMEGQIPEGGPHFVLSPKTSDGSPCTYGFAFILSNKGVDPAKIAVADEGDFDVTIWELVGSTFIPAASVDLTPVWGAFETQGGIDFFQRFQSFDVNATAIRFQFGNIASHGSIMICLSEL